MVVVGAVSAGLLLWLSVTANIERSCVVMDTPYLPICGAAEASGSPERLATLKRNIAANPGDAGAYVVLPLFSQGPTRQDMLRAASTVAPNDPNVLRARAVVALEREDWAQAVPPLVQLAQYYRHYSVETVETLARMIAGGQAALVQPHVQPGSTWFPPVLDQVVQLKLPLGNVLPLVRHASANGTLPPGRLRAFIRTLKDKGQWVDAYGLWLGQHKGRVPVLYNPSFDRDFQPDGFDWEVTPASPSRAGAIAETRAHAHRGQVLEVFYTGKSMPTPIVRQYLVLAAGSYRFAGHYMTSKLRAENGLAWSVRCAASANAPPAGQSAALMDTAGAWQRFDFEFTVPENCGPAASLQLETFAPYEATAGLRGRAFFDAFSLQKGPT
jgi:hypothetical protein